MSATPAFIAYTADLLAPLGPLSAGPFFGGHAFKHAGSQFAMVMGNTLYFCVNERTREAHVAAGGLPFTYTTRKGLVTVKKYHAVPGPWLDDPEVLLRWAREAIEVARLEKPPRATRR